jgi:hypothetical protein
MYLEFSNIISLFLYEIEAAIPSSIKLVNLQSFFLLLYIIV